MKKNRKKLIKKRKPNRSVGGDVGIYILLILFGAFFALPLVYSICTAFKPLDRYIYSRLSFMLRIRQWITLQICLT